MDNTWLMAMKAVVESSAQMSAWALAIFAGTVLAMVSSSYRRPSELRWRLPYLLYIPGWAFLGQSMFFGTKVHGKYLAALHIEEALHREAAMGMNGVYAQQQDTFLIALFFFTGWLLIYTIIWTFFDIIETKGGKT